MLAGILAGVVGCADSPPPNVTATLAFALPNGWSLTSASYIVWTSARVPILGGTEDLADSKAALSLNLRVPAGNGDVLQLTAGTSVGTSCAGTSAPFNVVPGASTDVSLVLSCVPNGPTNDQCPTVDVQPPTPSTASVPSGQISVAASATDPDPGDHLTFSWAASAGTFGDPTMPSTSYLCTTPGAQTLVLEVDDNHVPMSCTETFLLPITCLPPGGSDAGACADAGCGTAPGS